MKIKFLIVVTILAASPSIRPQVMHRLFLTQYSRAPPKATVADIAAPLKFQEIYLALQNVG